MMTKEQQRQAAMDELFDFIWDNFVPETRRNSYGKWLELELKIESLANTVEEIHARDTDRLAS